MLDCVGSVVTNEKSVQTTGVAEMLVKHHLGFLGELAATFCLKLCMVFQPSEKNKADILTRVKEPWLMELEDLKQWIVAVCWLSDLELRKLHSMCHMGIDRTLYLAKRVDANITRQGIQKVVGNCNMYQSIDPVRVCENRETSR